MSYKFIDLFAGIGGFHMALHNLGAECVFASEWDPAARKTYEENFRSISPDLFESGNFAGDITQVDKKSIPDFDILCAGFPCQPFSQAGFKRGFEDTRGTLFFEIAEIIRIKQPKAFFLENVRGLAAHDGGKTFDVIKNTLTKDLGYSLHYQIVKATDHGLPQHRPRLFMVGFRDSSLAFQYPVKRALEFNMSDVMNGNAEREIGFTLRVGGGRSPINDRRNWDGYIVDGEVRRLTPDEGKKMQGFPAEFKFPVTNIEAMKQLGNSVAVYAVQDWAQEIINTLEQAEDVEMNSANRGEWSELYALGYLLANGGGFGADEAGQIDKSFFYKVLEVVDSPDEQNELIYRIQSSHIEVCQNGIGIVKIDKKDIDEKLNDFLTDLVKQKKSRAFQLSSGEALLSLLLKNKVAAPSAKINDLQLVLEDNKTNLPTPRTGFSIKSEVGSPATVFNASQSTNLTFKIIGKSTPKPFQEPKRVKKNLLELAQRGFSLQFEKYDNQLLHRSLENIDSNLPAYLAELMLSYYMSTTTNIQTLCDAIWSSKNKSSELKKSKIKKFLTAASMGLRGNQLWTGYPSDFGGLLLVKSNGDVLFYYLYNLQKFEEYLFNKLRFETPSAPKHNFGQIYYEDGVPRIKLNLQIRF